MSLDVAALYADHRDEIFRYLLRRTEHVQQAEDLTQTVFLRALTTRHYEEEGRALSWLLTIAKHVWIDAHRARTIRHEPILSDAPGGRATSDAGSDRQLDGLLIDALVDALPLRQRAVIVDHDLIGSTMAETADLTGWPVNTIKKLRHRAVKNLRRMLEVA